MKTIILKDGFYATHNHTERMVALATKWLREYFSDGVARRPGQLEDDMCGEPPLSAVVQGAWRRSPFYPALATLVDSGEIEYEQDDMGDFWYALPGKLPSQEETAPRN